MTHDPPQAGPLAMGIDIGGTVLRLALLDQAGSIVATERTATDVEGGPAAVIEQIEGLIGTLDPALRDTVIGAGAGVPGPLDAERGLVHIAPALKGWVDVPFAADLGARLGLPVRIENDAHAAALGEWRFGAGRGLNHLVYVTVSTGIGGGAIVDGSLLRGANGLAALFGHMTVVENSPPCFCGAIGCWEAVASGSAMGWLATSGLARVPTSRIAALARGGPVTARHVFEASGMGDDLARSLVAQEAAYLARGFVNLLHLFSPDAIIVGGGVSRSLSVMSADIAAHVARRALPPYRNVPILEAALGDMSGVVGAASLVPLPDGRAHPGEGQDRP